jgi:predicted acetyltransferase
MDVQIRPIMAEEFATYVRVLEASAHGRVSDEEVEVERSIAEYDRQLAAFDGEAVVGGSLVATFRVSVPGGETVPAAGIKHVGVLPSHRRRGINTALMRAQLDDAIGRGECLALLHASEGGIYRRFGFGQATFLGDLRMETDRAAFLPGYQPQGRVRLFEHDDALPRMRPIYDAVAAARPGMIALDDPWFSWRFSEEPHHDKDLPSYYAIHETEAGEPDAYVVYEVKHDWPGEVPRLELTVHETMALTPQATADIWRFVFDIDLVHLVIAGMRPADDPLLWLLVEPRRMRFTLTDGMYARLVDVPAALEARGYASEGRIVFEVRDDFCAQNDGRFALAASRGSATCERTDESPDLACAVSALGATYLGGTTFSQLVAAGQIEERTQGASARADAIFRSGPAPWCSLPF